MKWVYYLLTGLGSAAFLLIPLGCVRTRQPSTASAAQENPKAEAPDRPNIVEHAARQDDLIRAILAAEDLSAAADAYRSLFKLIGDEGLPRLQTHASDTIAIQAAWMQVELTVPAEEPAQTVRPDHKHGLDGAITKRLYVSVWPMRCNAQSPTARDFRVMGKVAKLAFDCLAHFFERFSQLPEFNDRASSPKK